MELVQRYFQDVSDLRRFLFAAKFLSPEYPEYLETCCSFAMGKNTSTQLNTDVAKTLLDNIRVLDEQAFVNDHSLANELISTPNFKGKPVGIILLPQQSLCPACEGSLHLRTDRPSTLTLYSDEYGSVPATHYHKYCRSGKRGCKFIQYYGYATNGDGYLYYDDSWDILPYFISSQETAFETKFLMKFNAEMLIGQISYKQKADIYNYQNGYEFLQKQGVGNNTVRYEDMCVILH